MSDELKDWRGKCAQCYCVENNCALTATRIDKMENKRSWPRIRHARTAHVLGDGNTLAVLPLHAPSRRGQNINHKIRLFIIDIGNKHLLECAWYQPASVPPILTPIMKFPPVPKYLKSFRRSGQATAAVESGSV